MLLEVVCLIKHHPVVDGLNRGCLLISQHTLGQQVHKSRISHRGIQYREVDARVIIKEIERQPISLFWASKTEKARRSTRAQ